jgi:hypothetical protein
MSHTLVASGAVPEHEEPKQTTDRVCTPSPHATLQGLKSEAYQNPLLPGQTAPWHA